MSDRNGGQSLWWVRRIDGGEGHFFVGSYADMLVHINALHLKTGIQYAARQCGS
jgi:hypothetical protein